MVEEEIGGDEGGQGGEEGRRERRGGEERKEVFTNLREPLKVGGIP